MIALRQLGLTVVLVVSLPLWKKTAAPSGETGGNTPGIWRTLKIPGVKKAVLAFASYCAMEQSCMLWAGSYLVLNAGMAEETAAACAGVFVLGIAVGRLLSGFLTMKLSDKALVRLGEGLVLTGIFILLLGKSAAVLVRYAKRQVPAVVMGVGSAPVYPCRGHATPGHFGQEHSHAVIGLQSAGAFAGICAMPPLFGLLAQRFGVNLLPWYLLVILLALTLTHESLNRKTA